MLIQCFTKHMNAIHIQCEKRINETVYDTIHYPFTSQCIAQLKCYRTFIESIPCLECEASTHLPI